MDVGRVVIDARYAFPVTSAPIENARVEFDLADGRITAVRKAPGSPAADYDLGNVAIVPGFVNAHTHLELAALGGAWSPASGPEDEIEWLERVIASRRHPDAADVQSIISMNIKACLQAGTTALADITTAGRSWDALVASPLRSVVYSEMIGLKRERALQTSEEAFAWLARVDSDPPEPAHARAGLSPHAPYSTAGWLYERAAESGRSLSTHLAELPEEAEFLARGTGALRRFLDRLGAWDPDWAPIGPRPAEYVRRGSLRRADWLIAHGTQLEPQDHWQLRPEAAPSGQRVAVAYCPRTHARFRRTPHPYRALLESGAVVCVGTDSLASAPTLSVLDEIRFLHASDPSLGGRLLLTMATLFGAWALRLDHVCGSLEVGKQADLAVVPLPDRDAADPHDLLLRHDGPVSLSLINGRNPLRM